MLTFVNTPSAPFPVELREVAEPQPTADEALVEAPFIFFKSWRAGFARHEARRMASQPGYCWGCCTGRCRRQWTAGRNTCRSTC
jgi:hypothetical protein